MFNCQYKILMLWKSRQFCQSVIPVFLSLLFQQLHKHIFPQLCLWIRFVLVHINLDIITDCKVIIINMSNFVIMGRELQKNENSEILKQEISKATKAVEQRVYWFNTVELQGDFLQQYWQNQVTVNDIMKKRIAKITQQKFDELFAQVTQGKVNNNHELQVFHVGNLNLSELAQDIPVYNHKYFTQDHPKTLQTKAKLKQMHSDYQKFKEKIEQLKKKEQMKKKQREIAEEQMRQSLEKEKKQKYRQHVIKTIEQKNLIKEQRKSENQKYKQFLKAFKNSKPLHVLMEEEYKQKIELPILQENKKKLEQYKEYKQKVKPSLQQINQHQKSYLEAKQGRQSRIVIANRTIDVSFKSKFYLQQERRYNEAQDQYQSLFDQMEKKKRYSELVKENFKPKISQKLKQSIQQSQLKSTSVAKEQLDRNFVLEKGKAYLQFMHGLKKRKQHSSPSEHVHDEKDQQKEETKKQQKKQSGRYTNYLQALKKSRGNQTKLSHDWERDMRNKSLSQYERRQRILMKSRQLEEIASRKQQFVNNYHYGKPEEIIQKKKEIDQNLISSIRAKVAVLKDAHQI